MATTVMGRVTAKLSFASRNLSERNHNLPHTQCGPRRLMKIFNAVRRYTKNGNLPAH
jgi:hypothetical protein